MRIIGVNLKEQESDEAEDDEEKKKEEQKEGNDVRIYSDSSGITAIEFPVYFYFYFKRLIIFSSFLLYQKQELKN